MIRNVIGFKTLLFKEIQRFMRIWSQTILPPMITSTLYILIFGYSLGDRMPEMGATSYLQFILPGLILMGVITSSYSNTSSSLFLSKFLGNIAEILTSPLSYMEIILAFCLGGMLRGFLVGLGTLLVGISLTPLPLTHPLILLASFVIVSGVFSLFGLITALWATNFDRLSLFTTFLITPLIYVGGVFYSVDILPAFWQKITYLNPLFYMINTFRYGFLGISDTPVGLSLALLVALFFVLFGFTTYLLKIGYNTRT